MISSSVLPQLDFSFQLSSSAVTVCRKFRNTSQPQIKLQQFGFTRKPKGVGSSSSSSSKSINLSSHLTTTKRSLLQKSALPLAASVAILLCPNPAKAGFLSGYSGLESMPGPQLPSIEFLNRFNEENQKKYAEADARFKDSPILKQLLERSKLNKEKNKQEILDKYCIRGAEWGVGDCSAEGMTPDEREKFIAMLKQKAGIKD